jgi:hypothetical protein
MQRLLTLAASAALFSTLAFAETWTGRLVDGNCANPDKTAKECDAASSTTSFMLIVDGKAYTLDQTGNKMALDAIKNRADRAADPNNPKSSQIMAKVTGDKDGNTLKVAGVEVQ